MRAGEFVGRAAGDVEIEHVHEGLRHIADESGLEVRIGAGERDHGELARSRNAN